MFQTLNGHRQLVFSISINYKIYAVYSGGDGDEMLFTVVRGTDSNL